MADDDAFTDPEPSVAVSGGGGVVEVAAVDESIEHGEVETVDEVIGAGEQDGPHAGVVGLEVAVDGGSDHVVVGRLDDHAIVREVLLDGGGDVAVA